MRFILKFFCRDTLPEIPFFPLIFCFVSLLLAGRSSAQNRYGIIITECLPDPSPVLGLPESSFVELTNHSAKEVNLRNWKISNGSSLAMIKTDCLLKADSFLIICPSAAVADYSLFGRTFGISGFPALNNVAGDIILMNETGSVIHAVHYDRRWFDNELKAAGGWSLEMIDPSNACTGKGNWKASISPAGGTPGSKNSVDAENPDEQPPSLVRAVARDSLNLILLFDEALDSLSASEKNNYKISDAVNLPVSAITMPPFFDRVDIRWQEPLTPGKIYTLEVQQILDCSSNGISVHNTCKAGLPGKVKNGDIIFNEILFNPPPYGFDYIEIYNRSSKVISCSALFLSGRDISGSLKDPVTLVKEERAFFPGEYLLLTADPEWVVHQYPLSDPLRILSLSLPSMPDDQGKLVLVDVSGEVIDELDYDHHWHSPLLSGESGVALERISMDLPTSLAANWASAAADAGFGTPGFKNSESLAERVHAESKFISVEPGIFSPDMDGYRDFCFISYLLPDAGFTGSILIYDVFGKMVRSLVNNNLFGTAGTVRWDGLDDQQHLLPMGHYIIYAELFRTDGAVKTQKLVCVLARK